MRFAKAYVVTHVVYRKTTPYDPLEGPYSSVCNGLTSAGIQVTTLQLPLDDYTVPVLQGWWKKEKKRKVAAFFGRILPVKYCVDFFLIFFSVYKHFQKNKDDNTIYIGIDPLSTLPMAILRFFLRYKLVFYAVDYNRNRFSNSFLQFLYEAADKISSKHADYVWAVCERLAQYKKNHQGVRAFYIPNSNQFDSKLYRLGVKKRTGNKMAWTGSCITERQFSILFSVIQQIQKIHPGLEYHFAPVGNHQKFKENCKKYGLKKWKVHTLHSRREWQEFATLCDVGIAVYDDKFGSTKFIEPLKIWDFLLCGVPFIISCEPSISRAIKKAGVAFLLDRHNQIHNRSALRAFLNKENLAELQSRCLEIAREYDIKEQIRKSLAL